MISLADVYHVVTATVPLYVTMVLAYISVKWWKLFTPEQCSGINKFVANFSVPILSFQVISSNNIYKMSLKLIYADFVQKLLAFLVFIAIIKITARGGLKWIITGLSLSTLPNTLILGIPLMKAMYRDEASLLLPQIIFLQSMVWYNLLLFLHEFDAAIPARTMPAAPPSEGTDTETSQEVESKEGEEGTEPRTQRKMRILIILIKVGKKLIINPNTYATFIGLIWASIHFRWGVDMPDVVKQSIEILSSGGLGMATFSLGLFMASNSSIIACGPRMTMVAMGLKFLVGPAIMAVASIVIGLRGRMLKVAIVQAALPQGIVPFVFAREYNVNPGILSTGVLLGMLIALPVAVTYYVLLSL
ncbi:probable auxin efflux carrier component 8 isoform X2 [Abrus precatorius]|uniref:Auxin efflux carrier component n=1 Tax=Abrus precatorius TaxID=3816 RepID=A0A8B8LPV3_ABRPR|nr:probable auxin efflux carrier component 8 isoform X2 [Abrus precatorius]